MIKEWNLRPLRIAAVVVAALLVLAMNCPPTKYAATTWCGYPARVDRWTRLTHQEQVRLGWRLAPGVEAGAARELCETCHRSGDAGSAGDRLHHEWVRPGREMPDLIAYALMRGLQDSKPQFGDWDVVDLLTDPDSGGPVLVIAPRSSGPGVPAVPGLP